MLETVAKVKMGLVLFSGPTSCSVRNVCPTGKGIILRKIHQKLTAEGVKNLHLLSNEGMLGDDTEGTVDGCHPNDLGMMRQAEVFARTLSPLLGKN